MRTDLHQPGERIGIFTLVRSVGAKLGWAVRCECGRECTKHLGVMAAAITCGRECATPRTRRVPAERRIERHLGQRFGRLLVQEIVRRNGCNVRVRTLCDCGASHVAFLNNITAGVTTSCGCRNRESAAERFTTHGRSGSVEYSIWNAMRHRCGNPQNNAWADYGGRGITVCERWRESFENFIADMGARPSPRHSIDRINNSAGYSPENCRWATQSEQMRNTRRTTFIVLDGARVPAISVYEKHGISRQLFDCRVSSGWDAVRAATTPPRAVSPRKAAA